eukprot:TRINITY_DN14163_c0_g1_i1.p1 TRINITY_DN14163_c0_g1~~TRINITY_DN14163_c0_g1_i1.p1  ORF type:complete len:182 (+),score=45.60 TRINITY_DN14163_c0_g1_i1:49-546(+)
MNQKNILEQEALTKQFLSQIKEVFSIFDRNNDKTCDEREIGTMMRSLNLDPTEAEVLEIVEKCRIDEPSVLVIYDTLEPVLLQCMLDNYFNNKYARITYEKLLSSFRVFDTENNGYISLEQLESLLTNNGETFRDKELQSMIDFAGDREEGIFNYVEYVDQLWKI